MTFQPSNITPESKVIDPLIDAAEDARHSEAVPGDAPEACADEGAPSVLSEPVTGDTEEVPTCASRQDPLSGSDKAELNDAWITGADSPEWQALLDRPMTFLLSRYKNRDARQTEWKNFTGSFRDWLEGDGKDALSRHVVRQKKGYFPVVFGASAKAEGC
ncbi:hypothetical protein [Hyphomonas sp.]|uniref:hypothetical protein n=1 Tax=Hyphomonas sp. TaxID=87 RepID=UPI00391BBFFD